MHPPAGKSTKDPLSHPQGVLRGGLLWTLPPSTSYSTAASSHRGMPAGAARRTRRRQAEDGGALPTTHTSLVRSAPQVLADARQLDTAWWPDAGTKAIIGGIYRALSDR